MYDTVPNKYSGGTDTDFAELLILWIDVRRVDRILLVWWVEDVGSVSVMDCKRG